MKIKSQPSQLASIFRPFLYCIKYNLNNNNDNNNNDNNNQNNNSFIFWLFIFNFPIFWLYLFIPEKNANQCMHNYFSIKRRSDSKIWKIWFSILKLKIRRPSKYIDWSGRAHQSDYFRDFDTVIFALVPQQNWSGSTAEHC